MGGRANYDYTPSQLYSLLILHVTTELHSINYKWQIISYSCTFEDAAAGATAILRETNRMCEQGATQRSC